MIDVNNLLDIYSDREAHELQDRINKRQVIMVRCEWSVLKFHAKTT